MSGRDECALGRGHAWVELLGDGVRRFCPACRRLEREDRTHTCGWVVVAPNVEDGFAGFVRFPLFYDSQEVAVFVRPSEVAAVVACNPDLGAICEVHVRGTRFHVAMTSEEVVRKLGKR